MKFRSVGDAGDAAQRLRSGGFGPLPAGAAIAYAGPFETAFRKPVHEIVTEIDIHASAPQVWAALTDFSAYRKWNPVIVSVDGSLVARGWNRSCDPRHCATRRAGLSAR